MQKRRTNLYDSNSPAPFNVSRSKIDFFLECPQCFYLDRKLGISRPGIPGYTLNMAVDTLLKKEFDILREQKRPHRLMTEFRIDAIPFWHQDLHIWRDDVNKKVGASVLHKETNLNICGIVDDVWVNIKTDQLHIVDYKSTSTDYPISLDGEYKEGYKRQMEIYRWIFQKMGFNVSDIGYFFYVNAIKKKPVFNGKLEFEAIILPHKGDNSWVEKTIFDIKKTLDSNKIPESSPGCEYCGYRKLIDDESLKNQINLI